MADYICSDTKKNVFLIGDSIRMGYSESTSNALSNVAEVFSLNDNCRNTQYIITNLYEWANMFDDMKKVDVIHINCGHWDVAHFLSGELPLTSENEYKRNLQIIFKMLSELFPNAKIIFATTTTMNPTGDKGLNYRNNPDIAYYNELAKKVAQENNISVNDLYAITKDWDSSHYADHCHFNAESNKILGEVVAEKIKSWT